MVKLFFHHLKRVVWHLRHLWLTQLLLLLAGALAITAMEKIPFADALYFAFITGLTIGYGDLVPHTVSGRIISVALGFIGIVFSGLVVACATLALRRAWDQTHPPE